MLGIVAALPAFAHETAQAMKIRQLFEQFFIGDPRFAIVAIKHQHDCPIWHIAHGHGQVEASGISQRCDNGLPKTALVGIKICQRQQCAIG